MNNAIVLVARIFLAAIFVLAGFGKLTDPGSDVPFSTVGMIAGRGLPAPVVLAYLAGLVELLGGLAVLVGFQTRIAAWALALFCIAAGLLFHLGPTGDQMMDMINQIMLHEEPRDGRRLPGAGRLRRRRAVGRRAARRCRPRLIEQT